MIVSRKAVYLKIGIVLVLVACTGLACKNSPSKLWATSGHADSSSQAFRHWDNATNPNATITAACASCHSTAGFQQYMADATYNRSVANPPIAAQVMGIKCAACHTSKNGGPLRTPPVAGTVHFTASGQDASAGTSAVICGQCHQGRTDEATVDTAISKSATPTQLDTISSKINVNSFLPHYRSAFAEIKASKSLIGYTYGNPALNVDSTHAGGTDCIVCHNQHSSKVDIGRNGKNCQPCHQYSSVDDVLALNVAVPGLESQLLAVIKDYAADDTTLDANSATKEKACITYRDYKYPYWFNSPTCDDALASDNSSYASFTPRLAKACYNFTLSKKDPGGFAHNGGYISALLTASIVNLRLYNADLGK